LLESPPLYVMEADGLTLAVDEAIHS